MKPKSEPSPRSYPRKIIDILLPYLILAGFGVMLYIACLYLPDPFYWLVPVVTLFCFAAIFLGVGRVLYKITDKAIITIKNAVIQPFQRENPDDTTQSLVDMNTLPLAIMFISRNGQITDMNAAARDMLGVEDGEKVCLNDVTEDPGRFIPQWLDTALRSSDPIKPETVRIKRASADTYAQIWLNKSGRDDGSDLIAILNDATKMKTLEAQFVQSQKMQAIGQLAGGIAHDFNNLLTAICGYCDLMKLRYDKQDLEYGDLMQISQNANRATILVRQMLAFSRKQTLEPKPVPINDILSEHIHLLNRLVGEKIELRLDYSKTLPDAFIDASQLEQVIMNLVVNARDAMPNGGSIWIKTRSIDYPQGDSRDDVPIAQGQYISIELTDEGVGMPEDVRKKVFEPFYTTKNQGEGTGLGLSTVYGIIKQTGGYIFVDSKVDVGTTFFLLLPIVQEDAVLPAPEQPPDPAIVSALAHKGILLVEDEDPVRAFAARALRMQGVNLMEAASGEAALEIVKSGQHRIDIILTDIVMPGLNGPDWVKRARPYCADARVVFTSGYAKDTLAYEGAAGFIQKPFNLNDLITKLNEVLKDDWQGEVEDFLDSEGDSRVDSRGDSGADSEVDSEVDSEAN